VAWCREAPGRPARLFACAVKAAQQSSSPRAEEGNAPGRKAQESQGAATRGNPRAGSPNRQRDETPEAKPLRAAMPHAPKARHAPVIREGPALRGRAEESSRRTASLGEALTQ